MVTYLHPVDKGWAWVVAIGVFFLQFLALGYSRSYGILFLAFQEKYGYTAGISSLVAVFVTNVILKRFSIRTSCAIGALLEFCGVFLSIFWTGSEGLVFTQGALIGCGLGFLYYPGFLIVSQYFLRRRYIAMSLASCGSSVGALAFPLISRRLMDSFGLRGALLVMSALMAHLLVIVILFTPPSDYGKADASGTRDSLGNTATDDVNICADSEKIAPALEIEETHSLVPQQSEKTYFRSGSADDVFVDLDKMEGKNGRQFMNDKDNFSHTEPGGASDGGMNEMTDVQYSAEGNTGDVNTSSNMTEALSAQQHGGTSGVTESRRRQTTMRWPEVFGLKIFWLLVPYFMASTMAMVCPIFLPPLYNERGLEPSLGAILMALTGVADLLGRCFIGVILQLRLLTPTRLALFPFSVGCVVFGLTPVFSDFWTLPLITAVFGFLTSPVFSYQTLVVIENLGMTHLASAMGFYAMVNGLTAAASYPICGYMKDLLGTYSATFVYQATIYFFGLLFVIYIVWHRLATQHRQDF